MADRKSAGDSHEEGSSRAPDRDLLQRSHAFPGTYRIKAFGPSGDTFRNALVSAAGEVLGAERVEIAGERSTRSGDRVCVTLALAVGNVDDIVGVYDRLHDVSGLTLLL